MYTNIDIKYGKDMICHMVPKYILSAISIIMHYNVFQFSDAYWRQTNGTAMGHPPSCMWVTIYFSPHEENLMNAYADYLLFYKRYIDDIIIIWDFQDDDDNVNLLDKSTSDS